MRHPSCMLAFLMSYEPSNPHSTILNSHNDIPKSIYALLWMVLISWSHPAQMKGMNEESGYLAQLSESFLSGDLSSQRVSAQWSFEDLVEKRLRTFTKLMAVSPMILTFILGGGGSKSGNNRCPCARVQRWHNGDHRLKPRSDLNKLPHVLKPRGNHS